MSYHYQRVCRTGKRAPTLQEMAEADALSVWKVRAMLLIPLADVQRRHAQRRCGDNEVVQQRYNKWFNRAWSGLEEREKQDGQAEVTQP